MAGVLKTEVDPRVAAVIRPVNAVAVCHVKPDGSFAHTGVHDAWFGVRYGNRADGCRLEVAVRHILPVRATVVGFPDAARACAEIESA